MLRSHTQTTFTIAFVFPNAYPSSMSLKPSRVLSVQHPSSEPCPNNLIDIPTPSGEIKEIRHQEGHILVCQGCCCGNTEKGFPAVPLQAWKSEWKARGIRKRVHLTIAGCLGPCPMANVVLVIFRGACVWLQAIDSPRQVIQVYDVRRSIYSSSRQPGKISLQSLRF